MPTAVGPALLCLPSVELILLSFLAVDAEEKAALAGEGARRGIADIADEEEEEEKPNAADEGDGARPGIPLGPEPEPEPDGCGMPDPFLFMTKEVKLPLFTYCFVAYT